MSEETTTAPEAKTAPLGSPETTPDFRPGDVAEEPVKADLSDPETFKRFSTSDRDFEEEVDEDDPGPDTGSWDDLRTVREAKPKVAAPKSEEPALVDVTEEMIAAIEAEAPPPPPKVIKNPAARARILEKEVHKKDERIEQLEAKLDRVLGALEGKKPERADDSVREEDLSPAEKLLRQQDELKAEILALRRERQIEKEMVAAEQKLRRVSASIEAEQKENPVFVDALNHVARVMYHRVQKMPEFGSTEDEKKQSFARLVFSKQLEWADKGLDPVQEMYDMALDFGFDHMESARRHGVVFEGMEAEMAPKAAPAKAAAAVAKAVQTKPDPRAELALSKKRNEGTGTISGLTGKAPKRFNARNLVGKSDEEFRYEVRRAVAAGEIGVGKNGRPGFDELMASVAVDR